MKTNQPKLSILKSPFSPKPKPPKHLSSASKRWFRSVVDEWEMSPTDVKVLVLACQALDRAEAARQTLATEGEFYRDEIKDVIRAHPAVLVARDMTTLAARLIKDLRLDMPAVRPVGRPGGPGPTPKRSY